MRLTVATVDKIKGEKQHAEDVAADLRAKNIMLTRKLKTSNDPQGLIDEISKEKKNLLFLDENIVNLRGELSLREKKIEALTKELVIAHRSLEAQAKYEPLSNIQPSVANNREVMRTLYFDMGKKQADLHSVTLALADSLKNLETTKAELIHAIEQKDNFCSENEKLKGNLEYLGRQAVEYNDEVMHLQRELDASRRQNELQNLQTKELSINLAEARADLAEMSRAKQAQIEQLSSAVSAAEHERNSFREKLESTQSSIATRESIFKVREHNLLEEVARLAEQNAELGQQREQCSALRSDLEEVSARLAQSDSTKQHQEQRISELLKLLSQKESALIEKTAGTQALENNLSSLHSELGRLRDQCQLVVAERNESVEALRHTMKVTRELSQKYHLEREARQSVERTNEQLLQAKANLNSATLDALYQERRKSAALEKSLALVPLVLKWRSACLPDGNPAAANSAAASEGAEEFAHYYSSSTSAASGEGAPNDTEGKNLSNISKPLDASLGLHDGVNATFDWLLNENIGERNADCPPGVAAAGSTKAGSGAIAQMIEAVPKTNQLFTPAPGADESVDVDAMQPAPQAQPQSSPLKSPGVAAAMAQAYQSVGLEPLQQQQHHQQQQSGSVDIFAAALAGGVTSPGVSMVGELRRSVLSTALTYSIVICILIVCVHYLCRLRDELRLIEGKAPDVSMSILGGDRSAAGASAGAGPADASGSSSFVSNTSTTLHRTFVDNSLNNISVTTSMNLSSSK